MTYKYSCTIQKLPVKSEKQLKWLKFHYSFRERKSIAGMDLDNLRGEVSYIQYGYSQPWEMAFYDSCK